MEELNRQIVSYKKSLLDARKDAKSQVIMEGKSIGLIFFPHYMYMYMYIHV